jgi:hypothetical protein
MGSFCGDVIKCCAIGNVFVFLFEGLRCQLDSETASQLTHLVSIGRRDLLIGGLWYCVCESWRRHDGRAIDRDG